MNVNDLTGLLEAVLYVSGDPLPIEDIANELGISILEMHAVINNLYMQYDMESRGLSIRRINDSVQLITKSEYAESIKNILAPLQIQKLSHSAMETLSIIAYKQPVTRGDIEQIRRVKCDYSVRALVKKDLIKVIGKKDVLGHPSLYVTTDFFLQTFGISDLSELPTMDKYSLDDEDEEESIK